LLIEGLENHVTGSVGGIAGTPYRGLAEVTGMPPETPLPDFSVGGTGKGKALVLQIIHGTDGIFGENHGGFLVHQVVPALHRVEGVPFGLILFIVAQGGADAPLRSSGVAPGRVKLRNNRGFRALAGFQRGVEPGTSGTDNHCVKFMYQDLLLIFSASCSEYPREMRRYASIPLRIRLPVLYCPQKNRRFPSNPAGMGGFQKKITEWSFSMDTIPLRFCKLFPL
jgi:hypothetical protein